MVSDSGKVVNLSVDEKSHRQRIDFFLSQNLAHISRSKIQKIILERGVFLNGKAAKGKDLISSNDVVTIEILDEVKPSFVKPVPLDLDILFEDDYLMVINKPYGLVVHPGSGNHEKTLLQGLLYYAKGKFSPTLVHRLDKDTSGVLVCAKSEHIHEQLALQFKNKTNLREYVAILSGILPEKELTKTSYLKRHPVFRTKFCSMTVEDYDHAYSDSDVKPKHLRRAVTHFKVLKTYRQRFSMVRIELETGRTHQIRVHAHDLKTPVLGDPLYGTAITVANVFPRSLRDLLERTSRQMLHAQLLGFTHPQSGKKIAFKAELPEDMRLVLEELEKYID